MAKNRRTTEFVCAPRVEEVFTMTKEQKEAEVANTSKIKHRTMAAIFNGMKLVAITNMALEQNLLKFTG